MTAKKASSRRVVKTNTDTGSKKAAKVAQVKTEGARQSTSKSAPDELPFTRKNYILLIIGIVMISLGFILMSTEDFIDSTKFSIALYIAPFLVVGGFVEVIFAIMYSEKKAGVSAEG